MENLNLSEAVTNSGITFKSIVEYIRELVEILNPILFVLAFAVFFWGLSKFILSSGNPTEVTKGKSYMFWGILALFILISLLAIIRLISGELGLGGAGVYPLLPIGQ